MATIFEINEEIQRVMDSMVTETIDEETGEIINVEHYEELSKRLDMLDLSKMEKLENIGIYVEDCDGRIQALKDKEKRLKARREQAEKLRERLIKLLTAELQGEKLETPRIKISFRKSQQVEITDENVIPFDYLKPQPPKVDKAEIKKALKEGQTVEGARLKENLNIHID